MSGCGLAGLLRHRMAIERPDETRDELGGRGGGWVAAGNAWVSLEPAGRAGDARADARDAMQRFRAVLRARDDLIPGWRFVWRGKGLIVTAVEHDPRSPDRMTAWAEVMRESAD